MKRALKIWFLTFFCCCLTACTLHSSKKVLEENSVSIKQHSQAQFEYLTGGWESLDELEWSDMTWELAQLTERAVALYDQHQETLTLENVNAQLASLGYILTGSKAKRELQKQWISLMSGRDLVHFERQDATFVLCGGSDNFGSVCSVNGEQKLLGQNFEVFPQFYNGKLWSVVMIDEEQEEYGVFEDEKLIYRFQAPFIVSDAVLGLEIDESGWRLTYTKSNPELERMNYHLVHNGIDLTEQNRRDRAFGLTKKRNQIFFFFQKDGKIGYQYGNEQMMLGLEDIVHDACCSVGQWNIVDLPDAMGLVVKKNNKRYFAKISF